MKIWTRNSEATFELFVRTIGADEWCISPDGTVREYPARGVLTLEDLDVIGGFGAVALCRHSDGMMLSVAVPVDGTCTAHWATAKIARLLKAGWENVGPMWTDDGELVDGWMEEDI